VRWGIPLARTVRPAQRLPLMAWKARRCLSRRRFRSPSAKPRVWEERERRYELTKGGVQLRRKALKIPPAVIERLGVGLDELEHLHEVLTRINGAALAAGALEGERP